MKDFSTLFENTLTIVTAISQYLLVIFAIAIIAARIC